MRHWHTHIRNATTWQQLLQVARDYLASLEPQEWAAVPANCRPTRIKGIDDIDYWHRQLQEEFLPIAADVTDAHRRMLGFFRAASERAQELYGVATPPEEGATNDDSGAVPPRDATAGRTRD